MFEQDFEKLLRQYKDAVEDRHRFAGLVKDFFPGQQIKINLILFAYDLGVAKDIASVTLINNAFAFRFVKRLMDEYGISRANADWAISTWCVCYGKHVLGKACDIKLDNGANNSGPAIKEEKNGTVQYGDLFSYETSTLSMGLAVKGFTGENKQTIVFQNRYQNSPIVEIKDGAFLESEIREAIFTEGFVRIGEKAFYGCNNLQQAVFPFTVKEIGDYAFAGCANLSTLTLPMGLEKLGAYSIAGTKVKNIQIPASLYWLGEGAFSDCISLASIAFPQNLNDVPANLFKGCSSLRKVSLHDHVQKIGESAFQDCVSLDSIYVPDSVSEIGKNAFSNVHEKFILTCDMGSFAEKYARENKIKYQLI